jgi:cyclic pyranopterin phosphate synthase
MKTIKMIDISRKDRVYREAIASGKIRLKSRTIELIKAGKIEKGDPTQAAVLTGIQGSKFTPILMPLCHPIGIESSDINITIKGNSIEVRSKVIAHGKTGVEMEALTSTIIALLNIWDMVKKYEKDDEGQYPSTEITSVKVIKKVKKANG